MFPKINQAPQRLLSAVNFILSSGMHISCLQNTKDDASVYLQVALIVIANPDFVYSILVISLMGQQVALWDPCMALYWNMELSNSNHFEVLMFLYPTQ